MKQTYVKPSIVVERFSLAQSIAAGCAPHNDGWGHCNHWSKSTCGWVLPDGVNIAWISAPVCNDFYGENESIYGICYNNPEGGMTIFGS